MTTRIREGMCDDTGRGDVKTPYYEIDEERLDHDIALLQSALKQSWGDNSVYACSVKTNSLPWLLTHFKNQGAWAEVVSAEEYDLVMRLGFDPAKVIYNGPIKERDIFEKVLRDGGLVNLDSSQELEWLEELGKEDKKSEGLQKEGEKSEDLQKGTTWDVGLRINIDFAQLVPEEVPADAEGSRFGYSEENGTLQAVIARIRALPQVRITGLHLHSSTRSRSVRAYEAVAEYAGMLAKRYRLSDLRYIDMGGGFWGGVPDKPDFRDYVPAIAGQLERYCDRKNVTLILEPGVSMVSAAFTFVTRVRDVKHIGEHVYVVTDGSRVNLNPQVTRRWYPHHFIYREEYQREHPKEWSIPGAAEEQGSTHQEEQAGGCRTLPSQMICGATCMEYDRLFEAANEPELRPGDLVVYDLAGGYTLCLTPLFIHYFPAVFVKHRDGSCTMVREPWTNQEFLQKNRW